MPLTTKFLQSQAFFERLDSVETELIAPPFCRGLCKSLQFLREIDDPDPQFFHLHICRGNPKGKSRYDFIGHNLRDCNNSSVSECLQLANDRIQASDSAAEPLLDYSVVQFMRFHPMSIYMIVVQVIKRLQCQGTVTNCSNLERHFIINA
jgi:hypothetical protein